jgi:hypothetical protein
MKALEMTDGMDSEPTWHLRLPQHLKSAACGENLTGLNDAVQSLLVTLLFLGGITTQQYVATKQNALLGPTLWAKNVSKKRLLGKGNWDAARVKRYLGEL